MRGRTSSTIPSLLALALASAAPAFASVEGTWGGREAGSPARVVIGAGGATSIVLDFDGTPVTFTGSVTTGQPFTLTATLPFCEAELAGNVLANDTLIDAMATVACTVGPLLRHRRIVLERCGCDDGNATPGDGCDATCQVEPCWTCAGTPSVCTPAADGAACDDRRDCTGGTTCAAGLCGGGGPIASCVDMTGFWTVSEYNSLSTGTEVVDYDVTQRNGIVRIQRVGSTAFARFGEMNLATGAFQTGVPTTAIFCGGLRIGYRGVVVGDALAGTADLFSQHGIQCGVLSNVFTLDGVRSECPEGAACDDGDPCTTGDVCTGGTCAGTSGCNACERCSGNGCVPNVRLDCDQAAGSRSSLLGRNLAPTSSGPPQLTWKWKGGDGVALADLGDPTASTDYQLCVFEESGTSPAVLFGAGAPAASCGVEPCWKAQSTRGFQFRNRTGAGDGLTSVIVKTGAAGKASVVVKGKGDGLTDRPLGVPAPPFALPLRVQLQAAGGACFEARIDAAGTSRNGDGQFKGKTTAP